MREKVLEFELDATSGIDVVNAIESCIEERQPIILRVNETVGLSPEYLDRVSVLPNVTVYVGQPRPVRRSLQARVLAEPSRTLYVFWRDDVNLSALRRSGVFERLSVHVRAWFTISSRHNARPSIVHCRSANCTTSRLPTSKGGKRSSQYGQTATSNESAVVQ